MLTSKNCQTACHRRDSARADRSLLRCCRAGTPPAHAGAQSGELQNAATATQQLPDFTRIVEQNGRLWPTSAYRAKAQAGIQTPFQDPGR